MKTKVFCLLFFSFLIFNCSNQSDVNRDKVVTLFKSKWRGDISGYKLRSRGQGKGLIVKSDIECQKDLFHRYWYDSINNTYSFYQNEKFISSECFIDVTDSRVMELISLFNELSIYELIMFKNDYGIVQLSLSEDESIYYVHNLNLPKQTKDWLDDFAKQIDSNFYYVKGSEFIWRNL